MTVTPAELLWVPFVVVVVRGRLVRQAVARFPSQIGVAAEVLDALRDALGDATADVFYWVPAEAGWVDVAGTLVVRSAATEGRFTREIFGPDGGAVALLIGDESLRQHAPRVDAVAKAFALRLENARLQAAITAQLRSASALPERVQAVVVTERRQVKRAIPTGMTRMWENGALLLRARTVAALRGIPDTARYAEEWEYDLAQLPPGWTRFRWALSLRLRAPRALRRAAHRQPTPASGD